VIEISPSSSAIIVVDMLNDFVKPEGALVVPCAADLVPKQAQLLKAARESGMSVVYLADRHQPNDPEFKMWPPHAVVGTWGSEVIEELAPAENERVIPKRRYSGFYGTDLDLTLREASVSTVVLVGVLTDICVMYTSADASARGYRVIVVTDATGSVSDERHKFALEHMREVHGASLVTSAELLKAIARE